MSSFISCLGPDIFITATQQKNNTYIYLSEIHTKQASWWILCHELDAVGLTPDVTVLRGFISSIPTWGLHFCPSDGRPDSHTHSVGPSSPPSVPNAGEQPYTGAPVEKLHSAAVYWERSHRTGEDPGEAHRKM